MISDEIAVAKVLHIPLAPPRKGTPGEGIYLELWREWATARPAEWRQIFHETNCPVRQRAASVAASFMVFMGCNGGEGFTHKAKTLADSGAFPYREAAFIAAWALENRRRIGIDCGLRTSEYMLAAQHPITTGIGGGRVNWKHVPNITQDDNDILECMVSWWSTGPAEVMRSIAEPMIEAAKRKAWSQMFSKVTAA